jgi:predicted MFS family arabinose efflux permease
LEIKSSMPESSSEFKIAITGMLLMVVVIGLGRFALTPQLPHMILEKQITLTQASLVAAANLLGYLIGSLETIRARKYLIFRLKGGLIATIVILFVSGVAVNHTWDFGINLLLRFLAGFFSAWTFVLASAWVQQRLKDEHVLRTVAFSGPGVGIMLNGLIALGLDMGHTSAHFNWMVYGAVGLIIYLLICKAMPTTLEAEQEHQRFPLSTDFIYLMASYCICGISYILPATFLSKLAFDQFPGSILADTFWPLYGLAVIGSMVWLGFQKIKTPQRWLAMIFCMQGFGILTCVFIPGIPGLLTGTLFVGGAFIAILQLTMHLGGRLAPGHIRAMSGVLTTTFAAGQFLGVMFSAFSTEIWASIIPAMVVAAVGSFVAAYLANSIIILAETG